MHQSATCQNTTASGCRCSLHHPGLLGHITSLHLLPSEDERPAPPQPAADPSERLLAMRRAQCAACAGDPDRCQNGAGPPHFGRTQGCKAWESNGTLRLERAQPHARQPWEVRAA